MNNNATIKFNVKDKSALEFFKRHSLEPESRFDNNRISTDMSPYYFMRDEIILKKSNLFEVGTNVVFDLTDIAQGSRKELQNVYTYKVEEYDDVCVKLTLQDFKVNTIENK